MLILPELVDRMTAIPINVPVRCFVTVKIILKCIWKGKETKIVKSFEKNVYFAFFVVKGHIYISVKPT